MSVRVYFGFSWRLAKTLTVPKGTKAEAIAHVEEVERTLNLKRVPPYKGNIKAYGPLYPADWDYRRDWSGIEDKLLCETVEKHNAWVRWIYDRFAEWSKTPFKPTLWVKETEKLTPRDARKFWHGLTLLDVPPERWTRDYYRARMEAIYQSMRGTETEGRSFDAKALTEQQAGAVLNLFSEFLDNHDLRLDVVQRPGRGFNGLDRLASSYDGGYDWCEKCFKPIDPDCIGECRRRGCPLRRELDRD